MTQVFDRDLVLSRQHDRDYFASDGEIVAFMDKVEASRPAQLPDFSTYEYLRVFTADGRNHLALDKSTHSGRPELNVVYGHIEDSGWVYPVTSVDAVAGPSIDSRVDHATYQESRRGIV